MSDRAIVLDANILIRAILGTRVRQLILKGTSTVQFFAPAVAYAEARKYLPALLRKRGINPAPTMEVLKISKPLFSPSKLIFTQAFGSRHYCA